MGAVAQVAGTKYKVSAGGGCEWCVGAVVANGVWVLWLRMVCGCCGDTMLWSWYGLNCHSRSELLSYTALV